MITESNRELVLKNALAAGYVRENKTALAVNLDRLAIKVDPEKFSWESNGTTTEFVIVVKRLIESNLGDTARAFFEAGVQIGYLDLATWSDLDRHTKQVTEFRERARVLNALRTRIDVPSFETDYDESTVMTTVLTYKAAIRAKLSSD